MDFRIEKGIWKWNTKFKAFEDDILAKDKNGIELKENK